MILHLLQVLIQFYEHATLTLIDSEPEMWENKSPEVLERALANAKSNNKLPKAGLAVHLDGQSTKIEELIVNM